MNLAEMITLRDVMDDDLPIFFEHHKDPKANYMAVFTSPRPNNKAMFTGHWAKIRADKSIVAKTILYDGVVAGNILSFELDGRHEVSYWLGQEFWGKGIATSALTQLLTFISSRPVYGRAAKDNIGSIRVMQKCGFVIVGEDKGFSNARGVDVEEFILKLD